VPTPMYTLVSTAFSPLLRKAKKENRIAKLAGALQRYVARLPGKAKDTPAVNLPGPTSVHRGDKDNMESVVTIRRPRVSTAVDFDGPEVHPVVAEPEPQRQPTANVPSAHIKPLKDVMRDIDPDLPPRISGDTQNHDARTSPPSDVSNGQKMGAPEGQWSVGEVVYPTSLRSAAEFIWRTTATFNSPTRFLERRGLSSSRA
jgi:hypothetical protein